MNGFTSFAQGFRAKQDDNARKRGELAEAFELYRQNNPHASLAEMQAWIDAKSGGSNYIRGGVPSGSLLDDIASENATRKAHAESTASLARMRDRRETQRLMDEEVNRYLVEFGDPDMARQQFIADYGEGAAGLDLSGAFTNERADRVYANLGAQMWPQAEAILQSTAGDTSAIDLATRLGVPRDVAAAWKARFDTLEEERKAAKDREVRASVQNSYPRMVEIVKGMVSEGPVDIDGVINSVAEAFGYSPDLIPRDVVEAAMKEAETIRVREEEERERATHDRVTGYKTQMRTAIGSDPLITQALRAGNLDAAKRLIDTMVSDLPPEIAAQIDPAWTQAIIDKQIAALQEAQDLEILQRRDQFNTMALEAGAGIVDESVEFAEGAANYFATPEAGGAVSALSRMYALDERALPILQQALNEADGDPMALVEIGKQALEEAGIPTIAEARQMKRDAVVRQAGAVETDMTFDEWEVSARNDVNDFRASLIDAISDAQVMPDPAQRLSRLKATLGAARRQAEVIKQGIAMDEQNARRILTVGTPPWDRARSTAVRDSVDAIMKTQMTLIESAIRKADADAAAAAVPAPEPAGPVPTEEPSQFVKEFGLDDASMRGEFNRTWQRMHGELAKDQTWFGYFRLNSDAYLDERMPSAFLNDEGVKQQLYDDPAAWAAFQANPGDFLANSDLPWVKAFRDEYTKRYE